MGNRRTSHRATGAGSCVLCAVWCTVSACDCGGGGAIWMRLETLARNSGVCEDAPVRHGTAAHGERVRRRARGVRRPQYGGLYPERAREATTCAARCAQAQRRWRDQCTKTGMNKPYDIASSNTRSRAVSYGSRTACSYAHRWRWSWSESQRRPFASPRIAPRGMRGHRRALWRTGRGPDADRAACSARRACCALTSRSMRAGSMRPRLICAKNVRVRPREGVSLCLCVSPALRPRPPQRPSPIPEPQLPA